MASILLIICFLHEVLQAQSSECFALAKGADRSGLWPTFNPFCVIRKAADVLQNVPVVDTIEEMESYIKTTGVDPEGNEESPSKVVRYADGTPFRLPISSFSDQCTGMTEIEIPYSSKINCLWPSPELSQSLCESESLFNAKHYFGMALSDGSSKDNTTIEWSTTQQLLTPSWDPDEKTCDNVLQEVVLQLDVDSNRQITNAEVPKVSYRRLGAEDLGVHQLQFTVIFRQSAGARGWHDEYSTGDPLLVKTQNGNIPWKLATIPECASASEKFVTFGKTMRTTCSVRAPCAEAFDIAEELVGSFAQQLLPSPRAVDGIPVLRRNQPDAERMTSSTRCTLPTIISLDIAFAKVGTTEDFSIRIIGAYLSTRNQEVDLEADRQAYFTRQIAFKDVTKAVSYKFAAIPHIDLRLPSDFFYPIMPNPASSVSMPMLYLSLILIVARACFY